MRGGDYVTQENRIVFDLTDIKMVRHQCPKCRGEVSHEIKGLCPERFPKQCPLCNVLWGNFKDPLFERHCLFLDVLKKMVETTNPNIRLRLELDKDGENNVKGKVRSP